jgi:hypothetical protein
LILYEDQIVKVTLHEQTYLLMIIISFLTKDT